MTPTKKRKTKSNSYGNLVSDTIQANPAGLFKEPNKATTEQQIDEEVKEELKEIRTQLTENESLTHLLKLYSKLSKKYKKLKIKEKELEKILKKEYAHTKIIGKTHDIIPCAASSFEILASRAPAFFYLIK